MERIVKYLVKDGEEVASEFWIVADAIEYAEKFGGKVYKKVITINEYERIGDGVWL
jgi:hypothetical protein